MTGLKITGVDVSFRDGEETAEVLIGADLTVQPGEVAAISGQSGSGKSTLLGVASLLRSPDSGEVQISGVDTSGLSDAQLTKVRRDHVGIIFQSSELFPSLTALQQLLLIADINRESLSEAKERALDLLESVGLGNKLANKPGQMSGGERQRVGIARALMNSPAVILADEPTASLDPERSAEILDMIVAQSRVHNAATVVVSHDPTSPQLIDSSYELRGGTLHMV